MEWKMEWNSEHTQLQLTRATDAAQSELSCLAVVDPGGVGGSKGGANARPV